jgi:DNA-directed RNA polymerase specialized sigma24 family protein
MRGLIDSRPKDDAAIVKQGESAGDRGDKINRIAADLYNLASMLVGEGEQSAGVVETAIAAAEVSCGQDSASRQRNYYQALSTAAISLIAQRAPDSLAAPESLTPSSVCIEEDELDAAGISSEELNYLIGGPDRDRVRSWLSGLPPVPRTVFVLRAVAGFTPAETALLLQTHGGSLAAKWSTEAVREAFRQGLCSLASQLIHSSTAR